MARNRKRLRLEAGGQPGGAGRDGSRGGSRGEMIGGHKLPDGRDDAKRRDEELADELRRMPALITPTELSELTGMHVNSIRRGIKEGRIPADKVNGRWMVPAALLLRNTFRYMQGEDGIDLAAAEIAGAREQARMDKLAEMERKSLAELDDAEREVDRLHAAWEHAMERAARAKYRAEKAAARAVGCEVEEAHRGTGEDGGAACVA